MGATGPDACDQDDDQDVPDPLEYCAGVRARTFGSDFEIRVLSKELRVRVHVYASTGVRQRFPDPEEDENRRWPLVRLRICAPLRITSCLSRIHIQPKEVERSRYSLHFKTSKFLI